MEKCNSLRVQNTIIQTTLFYMNNDHICFSAVFLLCATFLFKERRGNKKKKKILHDRMIAKKTFEKHFVPVI